ncbi:hypothetical protein KL938_001602 [Ogataea parapolymorpha]|nr:hypothetical protein KL938_001602 [Ogataea parapolymorpha]
MADRKRGRDELEAAGSGWSMCEGLLTPDRTPAACSKKLQLRRITSELHARNGGAGAGIRPHNRQPGHLPSTAVLAQRAATGTYLSATAFAVLQPPLRPTSSP